MIAALFVAVWGVHAISTWAVVRDRKFEALLPEDLVDSSVFD